MRKYASIQNRVLVDYKKFRDSIISQIKMMQEVKDLNNDDEKRLKLKARQNMKLNETLSNYLKIRTA